MCKLIYRSIIFLLFMVHYSYSQVVDTKHELEALAVKINVLGYGQPSLEMQTSIQIVVQNNSYSVSLLDSNLQYDILSFNKFPEVGEVKNQMIALDNKLDPSIFALSIDPLAEQFPSESPYNSMGNNPIKYIDPDGKKIVIPNGQSEEFGQHVQVALDYLVAKGWGQVIRGLEESPEIIYLQEGKNDLFRVETKKEDKFFHENEPSGVIEWDPTMALMLFQTSDEDYLGNCYYVNDYKLAKGEHVGNLSPAIALLHEMTHASHFLNDRNEFEQLNKTHAGVYDGKEEERTIQFETFVLNRLGTEGRNNHDGITYKVSSPISTTPSVRGMLTYLNYYSKEVELFVKPKSNYYCNIDSTPQGLVRTEK